MPAGQTEPPRAERAELGPPAQVDVGPAEPACHLSTAPDFWSLPTANEAPLTWALMGRGGPSSLPAEVSPPMLSEGPAHGVPLPVRVGRTWDLLHIVEPGMITLPYLRYLGGQPRGGAQRALPAHSQLDAGPLGPRLRKWSCPHQAGTIPLLGGPFMSTTGARRVANR